MVEYGKVIVSHKYPMVFMLIINVWTATFFPTLKNIKGIIFLVFFFVEKEGIQMVEQAMERIWIMC
jgi:hypothetical protein